MKLWLLTILFASALAVYAGESDKLIYGRDDRVLVGGPDMPKEYSELADKIAQATAVHVDSGSLFSLQNGKTFKFNGQNLQAPAKKNMCAEERFGDLPVVGNCSGFLVGPDLLVTAGHCVKAPGMCERARWIFGNRVDRTNMRPYGGRTLQKISEQWYEIFFPASDVYSCKKVIRQIKKDEVDLDFALIQLDRKVEGRQPLEYRRQGKLADDAQLAVVGHPLGLPSMITLNGSVRENHESYTFLGTHDTFSGNSGSPVVDMKTGLVEGLLIRGDDDFKRIIHRNQAGQKVSCQMVKRCQDDECEGERAQRINIIPELAPELPVIPDVLEYSKEFLKPPRATWPDDAGDKLDKV